MSLKISLDSAAGYEEQIYRPYVEISYTEKKKDDILASDSGRNMAVKFVSEYFMDTSGFWSLARAVFIILLVVLIFTVLVMICVYLKADRLEVDQAASMSNSIIKSFTIAVDMFSTIFFWYTFFATGWWFVFFKFQEAVYALMPGLDSYEENYKMYDVFLVVLTVMKFISLAYKIGLEQSQLDIFLIDWESDKMYQHKNHTPKKAVSPWRRLYIVNEFNEMQKNKMITSELILLTFLVIAEGFGFKYYSLMEPNLARDSSDSPESYILNFFVITCIIFGVGCLEYTV